MVEFHHHPDGIVYLRGDGNDYAATLDEFAVDAVTCGLPTYVGLPVGYRERRYLPGVLHALYSADSQDAGGDWPQGDLFLAAKADLIAAALLRAAS